MGFLGPIPASKLAASYDFKTRTLTLSAEGTIQEATYGITFKRLPWMGGLKFILEGWTGPLTGEEAPYEHSQSFDDIQLPNPAFPSDSVIIVDATKIHGVKVPIHWVGGLLENASNGQQISKDSTESDASQQVISSPSAKVVTTRYKEPFNIRQSAEMPKYGTIDMKFDASFLTLQNAGIDDGNIVWKFDPVQVGDTQVVITLHGGIADYVRTIYYNVHVVFPLGPGPVITSSDSQVPLGPGPVITGSDSHVPLGPGPVVPTFLARVKHALQLVEAKYPGAKLYNVHATTHNPEGVTTPVLLTHLKIIFRVDKGSVTIESPGYYSYGPLHYNPEQIMGNENIDWPVGMDAIEADSLIKKAGQSSPYSGLTLRHPLYPGITQTYYIFKMIARYKVFVGVKNKKVSINHAEEVEK